MYRRKMRKGYKILRVVILFIVFALAFAAVETFFKISKIEVTGNGNYASEFIIDTAEVEPGDSLVIINKSKMRKNILDACSFVESVNIKRKFPDTLIIELQESQLLACLEADTGYCVINRKCRIVDVPAVEPVGYIKISGIKAKKPEMGKQLIIDGDASEGRYDYLCNLLELLPENDVYTRVTAIDASNIASYSFDYDGRLEVVFGKNENLEKKFKLFLTILGDLSEADRGTINLSQKGEGHFIPK